METDQYYNPNPTTIYNDFSQSKVGTSSYMR